MYQATLTRIGVQMRATKRAIAIKALLREWGRQARLQESFTPRRADRFGRLLEDGEPVVLTVVEFEALRDLGLIRIVSGLEDLELGARFELTREGRETLERELAAGGSRAGQTGGRNQEARRAGGRRRHRQGQPVWVHSGWDWLTSR